VGLIKTGDLSGNHRALGRIRGCTPAREPRQFARVDGVGDWEWLIDCQDVLLGVGGRATSVTRGLAVNEKFAATLPELVMNGLWGVPPERLPLKPINWYPLLGIAVTVTVVPLLYQPLALAGDTVIVPDPGGFTDVVSRYCVVKAAV
jgi:hypothetical protein